MTTEQKRISSIHSELSILEQKLEWKMKGSEREVLWARILELKSQLPF